MLSNDILSSLASLREKHPAYLKKLNAVSEGIRTAETLLQSMNVGLDASLEMPLRHPISDSERPFLSIRNVPGWEFLSAYVKEQLLWCRDSKSGKYRLMCERILFEDRVAYGDAHAPNGSFSSHTIGTDRYPDGVIERKPLIECSIETRLRAWEQIHLLIQNIEKQVDRLNVSGGFNV